MLSVGIVGLPNSGKSTLFNTLVGEHLAKVADYPFTTIEPNVAVIAVPDERLDQIARVLGEGANKIPATIKFVDIAGLVEGAHQGKGLGNQFLGHIQEVDAIVLVTRSFDLPGQPADPKGSEKIVKLELELGGIKKPTLVVENTDGSTAQKLKGSIQVNAQTGEGVGELIKQAYQLLDLITFYTFKDDPAQIQAWPIKQGATAKQAAGKVHTDMERGFIKAEVVGYDDFIRAGGKDAARSAGKLRIEGKDQMIRDGEVVEFRFRV